MSAMMIVLTASQKVAAFLDVPVFVLGQQQLDADPQQQHAANDLDVRQRHQQCGARREERHQDDDAACADDERLPLLASGQRTARERDDERVVAAQHDVDDGDLEERAPGFGIGEGRQHEHSDIGKECSSYVRRITGACRRNYARLSRGLLKAFAKLT